MIFRLLRLKFIFIGAVVTLLLSGCMAAVQPAAVNENKSFSKLLRGTVYLENSQYKIRLCGTTTFAKLFDPKQQLISHFTRKGDLRPTMYLEFSGTAAQSLDWQVDKILFSSVKANDCGLSMQSLDYLAKGKKGLWQARVIEDKVQLSKQNIYSQLEFLSVENKKNSWSGEVVLATGRAYKMNLTILQQECMDQLQQWYALSAELRINGESHLGCVRKGDSVTEFNSGKYSNILSAGNAFIVLNLASDNSVKLILDYRNGHPIVVSKGQWKMHPEQILEVALNSTQTSPEQSVMLFQVFNNNELRLKGFSELLGNNGLKLLPVY